MYRTITVHQNIRPVDPLTINKQRNLLERYWIGFAKVMSKKGNLIYKEMGHWMCNLCVYVSNVSAAPSDSRAGRLHIDLMHAMLACCLSVCLNQNSDDTMIYIQNRQYWYLYQIKHYKILKYGGSWGNANLYVVFSKFEAKTVQKQQAGTGLHFCPFRRPLGQKSLL